MKILSASSLAKPALRQIIAFETKYLHPLWLLALGLADVDHSALLGDSAEKESLSHLNLLLV